MRKDKPSRTAYKVALNIVTLGAKPGMEAFLPPGIVHATRKLLVASGAAGEKTVKWAQSPKAVSIYEAFDWILPGQFEAFAHRKAFCEQQIRDGIDAGATQILVLGAGYDTTGWRLAPKFPHVLFFEIDHPATAHLKAKGIETMGGRDNLILLSEDLINRKIVDVFEENKSWNRRAKTVIVAEGLLMYLSNEAVRDLFRQSAMVTGADSRIVFSYIPSDAEGCLDAGRWTGLMLWLQKTAGEPWLWSIRPEQLAPFLADTGWKNSMDQTHTPRKYGVEFYAVASKTP
jgi:methyltransferase (TIGR00027 family)